MGEIVVVVSFLVFYVLGGFFALLVSDSSFNPISKKEKVGKLELAKKAIYAERQAAVSSRGQIEKALSYVEKDEPIDWSAVINSRLEKDSGCKFNSLTEVARDKIIGFDSFSVGEKAEILDSCLSGWIDGLKHEVGLVVAEKEILEKANLKHGYDATLHLEKSSDTVQWDNEFRKLLTP